jgi:hypothetical protein
LTRICSRQPLALLQSQIYSEYIHLLQGSRISTRGNYIKKPSVLTSINT